MLGSALRMRLRHAEGLLGSVLQLMGLTLPIPDHMTRSRRAKQRLAVSHVALPDGPLEVLVDSTGLQLDGVGQWLQEKHGVKSRRSWRKLHLAVDAGTAQIVARMLTGQDGEDPSQVTPLLDQIPAETGPSTQRDCHREAITAHGRLGWQKASGYGRRTLVETTMGRDKALIVPRLRARDLDTRQTEAAIGVAVLNRMLAAARPKSVRCNVRA